MIVKQLIDKLKEFLKDLPIATWGYIDWKSKDDPNLIKVTEETWTHQNYPYDKDDFDYINLE